MIDTAPSFLTSEVCRLAGITFRQADHWCRLGYVRSSVADARGSGYSRRWSAADLLDVLVVKGMVAARAPADLRQAAVDLARISSDDYLWVQGEAVRSGGLLEMIEAVDHIPATFVLNLRSLRDIVRGASHNRG